MTIREGKILLLDAPITNPKPDGRKRSWAGAKQFPAGRYVLEDTGLIYRADGSRYDYVGRFNDKAGAEAICAAARVVEPEGIREQLAVLHEDDAARSILGVLLHTNIISVSQIRSALEQLDADENLYDQI